MDFEAIQRELDSDTRFKVAFIKSPGTALRSRGFDIDPEQERDLVTEIDEKLAKADVAVLLKLTIKF